MTGALWRSAFVAAVFAIHPLRVESVAWVAERKDVLSGLFFMLTIGAYVRYARCVTGDKWQVTRTAASDRAPGPSRVTCHPSLFYCLVLLCFALGLMCKPMLVSLPLVLLLLDYWPLGRVTGDKWQVTGEKKGKPSTFNSDKSRAGPQPSTLFDYVVVPFDQIFQAVRSGQADVGLIIHEGQLTYQNEGLVVCEDLGVWWGKENDGLPLPLGGNVIHKKFNPALRREISEILTASIRYSLNHRAEAVQHALPYARDMGRDLADKFVGMYVNHWTLDYGEKGRESIRRFLGRAFERGLIPHRQELEFVV
jgi:hypothetical protein